jgi:hypothetical protein
MNWDYVRGKRKKRKIKINKQKGNKQKNKPRDLESFKGGNFNTLSLVDCYVQICNGTAVEHGSLLNCSGVCEGCKRGFLSKTNLKDI